METQEHRGSPSWVRAVAAVATVLGVGISAAACAAKHTPDGQASTPGMVAHTAAPSGAPVARRAVSNGVDQELANATVDIPGRGPTSLCKGGRLTFTNAVSVIDGELNYTILKTVESDLDGDGTTEVTALLTCAVRDPSLQVVTFSPTGQGGFTTVGTVLQNEGPVATIYDLRLADGGAVSAQVSDHQVSRATDAEHRTEPQWRTYARRDGTFAQVAGPTTFPADQRYVDLDVSTGNLVLEPAGSGRRHGVLKVTVRNNGTLAAPSLRVDLRVPVGLTRAGDGWAGCDPEQPEPPSRATVCHYGELAPGASRVLSLEFTANEGADLLQGGSSVHAASQMPSGESLADSDQSNNSESIRISRR
ncbi:hypothetical protein Lfu02_23020 [Longispora fulva]|uniref:DUF11 domain-containing protein n=1 Tax=Longispora fulva TaxID=619741 RepID=A0A8J7GMN6_9ACTN|nr:DUF11 domain-containing protein [Longispora fulva]MBG6139688.1 hypothetical protein [Longispora fulva]GIG57930.1 hypothetical protein Lfu02_23020 [Longispora fulva]